MEFAPMATSKETAQLDRERRRAAPKWDDLLTAQEVADLVRVHLVTFRKWCLAGKGPVCTDLHGQKRYARSAVLSWLQSRQSAK
jgi:hypothetical protein